MFTLSCALPKLQIWTILCSFFISQILLNGASGEGSGMSPLLLVATHEDIRLIPTGGRRASVLVRDLSEGSALDVDIARERVCWTDHAIEAIQCVGFNGSHILDVTHNLTAAGPVAAEGLAIDWYTGNLYWTDGELDTVEVANADGLYRRVLYWTDIDQPRAIVLVPMKSLLFWTDWGEIPKIERASMTGDLSSRKVIVSENIYWPNGMAVDYQSERVYWLDGKFHFIAVMDYNGDSKQIMFSDELSHPFAITYFGNKVYWTDWASWSVHSADVNEKNGSSNSRKVFHSESVPMAISVWDPRRQPPGHSPCMKNKGGCSHLCLVSSESPGFVCSCPTGIVLKADNRTCRSKPQNILLLAQRTHNSRISLDTPDHTAFVIPLEHTKHTIALDYDPVDDFLYWTDDELKMIRKSKLDGTEEQDVIDTEIAHPDGIAIDWVARNLYWTDTGFDRIEVASILGGYRRAVVSEALSEPRAVAVAPKHGWLFWTDWAEKNPKIERASLDGSERVVIVTTDLGWPNGLALDLENSKVYWGDANKDKIEVANMDGTDRRVVLNDNLPHLFSLTLLGDYLYWTDWQRRSIDRVHKVTGKDREVISEPLPNIMGLKAVHLGKPTDTNMCSTNNGGCSHLCFQRPRDKVCACPIGYELATDKKTCIVPSAFLLVARKDSISRLSVQSGHIDVVPITGLKAPRSLDLHIENNRMYWTDARSHSISRAYLNGSDAQRVIETGATNAPSDLSIDWIAHNVYWTSTDAKRIEIARLEGSSRRTLVWEDLDAPNGIVVDPNERFLFWSEWGEKNRITRSLLDGSQRNVIVTSTTAQGLSLDYEKMRIYWADARAHSIRSVDYYGLNELSIVSNDVYDPNGITVYKNKIFWADRTTKDIESAEKSDGGQRLKIINLVDRVEDILIYHKTRQSGWNECEVNNGGCQKLCFALPDKKRFNCGCPTHFTLRKDNTCTPPKEYLLYSQRSLVGRLLPDTSDCPDAALSLQAKLIRAIEYDPITEYLYWIEGKYKTIRRALYDGSRASVIVHDAMHIFDLAIDPIGRLLFWSDSETNVINITRLNNGSAVGIAVSGEKIKPRQIGIHPFKRFLFYIDIGNAQITRCKLDGSESKEIRSITYSSALVIDPDADFIFWYSKSLFRSDLNGANIKEFNIKSISISNLAVLGKYLYWIDSDKQQIERMDKLNGMSVSVLLTQRGQSFTDLIPVRNVRYENHSCYENRCSHVCINTNDGKPVCGCPSPLVLHDDGHSCITRLGCDVEYFTCTQAGLNTKECIPATWRCDGQRDCPDSSDEQGCPECKDGQFRCRSGQCIDRKWVCDGTTHCPDGHDEAQCCPTASHFQCPSTGVCIAFDQLCNEWDDCADGADETEALCSNKNNQKLNPPVAAQSGKSGYIIGIVVGIGALVVLILLIYHYRLKISNTNPPSYDQSMDPLSPPGYSKTEISVGKKSRQTSSGVCMSVLSGSLGSGYDRSHITGASSSTNGSYPRETLNPPPSPATTVTSTRASSYRPYRHYRSINQPPPPTPCSTDVCDESDSNCRSNRYDVFPPPYEPFPPPPTPRESCPPSPSSRSSTTFSPLPPPPSPVPSAPRGYDS